ncbi:hypothetical protein K431DRAFT_315564 [Polychaeton citri CBS 116435]|uniref:HMG box domain-containing protein n=1 Tax=Polychaeton citri CBS 116435 TaxID=1314669 RepID=A0A9P4ULW0_9PEZI|nr:hypothetical protein K431DRAFT_315564 [Polychaeton citri CBS 116435]
MLGRCVTVAVRCSASTRLHSTSTATTTAYSRVQLQCLYQPALRSFSVYARHSDSSVAAGKSTKVKKVSKPKTAAKPKKKPAASKGGKPKTAPKKPVKKVLTDEEKIARKEKRAVSAEAEKIKQLKKAALDTPKLPTGHGGSAWQAFYGAQMKEHWSVTTRDENTTTLKEAATEAARKFQDVKRDPVQLEHWTKIAEEHKLAVESELRKWLETKSVEELLAANQARAILRRKLKTKNAHVKYASLKDDRIEIKRPGNAFSLFVTDMYSSGEIRGVSKETGLELSKRWRELPSSEKEKYQHEGEGARKKYVEDYKVLYGKPPPGHKQVATS